MFRKSMQFLEIKPYALYLALTILLIWFMNVSYDFIFWYVQFEAFFETTIQENINMMQSFEVVMEEYSFKSSANIRELHRPLIKTKSNSGPILDPWGSSLIVGLTFERRAL